MSCVDRLEKRIVFAGMAGLTAKDVGIWAKALPKASSVSRGTWSVGLRGKVYSHWQVGAEQPGLHLRSNSSELRADARVKPSAIKIPSAERKNNFVWLDPSFDWAEPQVKALLAESHALACRKDGGVLRNGEFSDLFIALRKPLEAARPELRPGPVHHAGGPAAKILRNEAPTSAALALWCATLLADLEPAPATESTEVRRLFAQVANPKTTYEELWSAAYDEGGSRALQAARHAVLARGCVEGGYDTRASSYAAASAVLVVNALTARGETTKVTEFIAEIDDRVLAAEFAAVARERLGRELQHCERVLWRGTDPKGNANQWLVRLRPELYALLHKLGARWAWAEGSRDDMLATIRAVDFAAATAVAFARDVPGEFGAAGVVVNPKWERRAKS